MNKQIIQEISSLLDNEVSQRKAEKVFRKISDGKELRHKWERYQLIRDALRRQTPKIPDRVIQERIRQALRQEPSFEPSRWARRGYLWLTVSMLLLLAAAMVLSWQHYTHKLQQTTQVAQIVKSR